MELARRWAGRDEIGIDCVICGIGDPSRTTQFSAKDFKEFIPDLRHDPRQNLALLSPIERENRTLAEIAPKSSASCWEDPCRLEDAWRLAQGYVEHYNNVRLNSAVGYITPKDVLAGRQQEVNQPPRAMGRATKRWYTF